MNTFNKLEMELDLDDYFKCDCCKAIREDSEAYNWAVDFRHLEPDFHQFLPIVSKGVTINEIELCEECFTKFGIWEDENAPNEEQDNWNEGELSRILIFLNLLPRKNKRRSIRDLRELEYESRLRGIYGHNGKPKFLSKVTPIVN